MPNDWIIDILSDLKAFAELNGMEETAASLEDTSLIALAELSSFQLGKTVDEEPDAQSGEEPPAGNVTFLSARRGLA